MCIHIKYGYIRTTYISLLNNKYDIQRTKKYESIRRIVSMFGVYEGWILMYSSLKWKYFLTFYNMSNIIIVMLFNLINMKILMNAVFCCCFFNPFLLVYFGVISSMNCLLYQWMWNLLSHNINNNSNNTKILTWTVLRSLQEFALEVNVA